MDVLFRISLFLVKLLHIFLYPLLWFLSLWRESQKVPPANDKLLNLSATILADKIRKQELKSETIVRSYIARIKQVNPFINAIVEDRFEEAVQEAISVDKQLQNTVVDVEFLKATQPLLGVPVTVKETCAVKGMSHCAGSISRRDIKATEDGNAIKLVREAGAIILLTSNTPEFCCWWEGSNLVTGTTKNPRNTQYSPGGSSSGEGALLGAGASIIGIGSDVAGSIRLPAALNGVFGHKGTSRMVSVNGHFPTTTDTIECSFVIGPLVRFAEDLPLVYKVLCGHRAAELNLNESVNLSNLNVFSMHNTSCCITQTAVSGEIQDAIDMCVQHLRQVCHSNISQYQFPMRNSFEIANSFFYEDANLPNILEDPQNLKHRGNLVMEYVKKFCGLSKHSMHGLIFEAFSRNHGFIRESKRGIYLKELAALKLLFQEKLNDNGVLLLPTFPINAFRNNEFLFRISGVPYLSIFNVLELPCTSVPLGLAKNKMPLAIQVVAGKHQDRLCFAVAKELERAFGGWCEIN